MTVPGDGPDGGRKSDCDNAHLSLQEVQGVADLSTFLSRARVMDAAAARLQAIGEVLAVTVCALEGTGLFGGGTVLGLRAFRLREPATTDVVVALDAMSDRLARMLREGTTEFAVPPVPVVASWAGQSPPRTGWSPVGEVDAAELRACARAGIERLGSQSGAAAVERDRVWQAPVPGHELVPAGAAFAAHALGFLPPATHSARIFTCGPWRRLATDAGQVLVR